MVVWLHGSEGYHERGRVIHSSGVVGLKVNVKMTFTRI